MFGYFALFFLLFIIINICNSNNKLLYLFIILTFFSAIRYGIGYDYYSYYTLSTGWATEIEFLRFELIPRIFCKLSVHYNSPNLFFVLSSIFISIFYYYGIKKESNDYAVSFIFYLCFPFFFMDQLGVIRQGMAISVIFCAITAFKNNFKAKLVLLLIACLCHNSAIICLIILIPWTKINVKYVVLILIFSVFFEIIFVNALSHIALQIESSSSEKFLNYLSNENIGEGKLMKYLIYLLVILILLFYNKLISENESNHYYICYVTLGTIIYVLFADINSSLSKRLAMFFYSTTIIVIPDLCRVLRINKISYYATMITLFYILVYVIGSQQVGVRLEDHGLYGPKYPYRTIFQKEEYEQQL